MKKIKRMFSTLLVCILILSPTIQPVSAISDAQTTFIYDGTYLTVIGNNSPYFSAFIEKILIPYELAIRGHYEEAKTEFESCVDYIKYELKYFTEYNEPFLDDISSYSSEILKVINFYVDVMFAQSELMLNTLAEYINGIQKQNDSEKCEKLEKTFFDTRDNLEQNIFKFQYLRDQITVAFVFVYAHPDATASDYKEYVIDRYKKPLSETYDPYTFYSKNKSKIDQEYDFDNITEIIILPQDVEAVDEENSLEQPAVEQNDGSNDYVASTIPVSALLASVDVPEADQHGDGTYKVGFDIVAGEYIAFSTGKYSGYVCVSTDANQNDILENEIFYGSHYITVSDEQYLQVDNAIIIPAAKYNVGLTNYIDIAEGMYKVGTDIPAGEYKVSKFVRNSSGYYCIYNNSNADRKIVNNNIFKTSAYVTVNVGDYLLLSNATATLVESAYDYVEEEKVPTTQTLTVYWIKNGKVYHKSPNCPTLDLSTNIRSGSVTQSGKDSLCKVCG